MIVDALDMGYLWGLAKFEPSEVVHHSRWVPKLYLQQPGDKHTTFTVKCDKCVQTSLFLFLHSGIPTGFRDAKAQRGNGGIGYTK